jgi:hypothetical protein
MVLCPKPSLYWHGRVDPAGTLLESSVLLPSTYFRPDAHFSLRYTAFATIMAASITQAFK